ncbi:hypothetical protein SAMN05192534_1378 [Alteribacillus persepolensis]|uniref:Uncharacterized protein n=1 Tax=Alteribacillus persepolensis TaxID=568899 RepID=A0A1G8JTK1_9BACI|nr:hypothetical protein SAMN05192534_1378 [Alteribacillus persepolensis]
MLLQTIQSHIKKKKAVYVVIKEIEVFYPKQRGCWDGSFVLFW